MLGVHVVFGYRVDSESSQCVVLTLESSQCGVLPLGVPLAYFFCVTHGSFDTVSHLVIRII